MKGRKVSAYHEKLAIQRRKKRERRACSNSSSSSGFFSLSILLIPYPV